MANIIFFDKDGQETKREIKGKGRPPRGAVKTENGDFHVFPVEPQVTGSFYIEVDDEGNETSRETKGRGRNRPDYEQREDGNWYRAKTSPVLS